MKYLLKDGTEVTTKQISEAFKLGKAVLCHVYGDGKTLTSLMLDGEHYDTRGQCFSMWDEAWTTEPRHIFQCYLAAEF